MPNHNTKKKERLIKWMAVGIAVCIGLAVSMRESRIHVTHAFCTKIDGRYVVDFEVVNPRPYVVDATVEILIGDGSSILGQDRLTLTLEEGQQYQETHEMPMAQVNRFSGHFPKTSVTVVHATPHVDEGSE